MKYTILIFALLGLALAEVCFRELFFFFARSRRLSNFRFGYVSLHTLSHTYALSLITHFFYIFLLNILKKKNTNTEKECPSC